MCNLQSAAVKAFVPGGFRWPDLHSHWIELIHRYTEGSCFLGFAG